MEIKKSKKADLERHSAQRYLLALAVAVALFITVIEFNSGSAPDTNEDKPLDHLVKDLATPAVDRQDRQANKPQTKLKNEIHSPEASDKAPQVEESSDQTPEKAKEATEAQAGQGLQQLATVKEAPKPEDVSSDPQPKVVNSPPAPLDPVAPATEDATNLAVPPGGWANFNKWMGQTLKFPQQALNAKQHGDLVVAFVVAEDGTVSQQKVVKSAGKLFDDEALRVIRMMGKWKPSYRNGAPCKSYIELPVSFNL